MTTFEELLATNEADVKEPIPLPPGHYRGFMAKYEQLTFNRKNPRPGEPPTFSKLRCTIKPVEPCSDVDPAVFAAYSEASDINMEELRQEFMISEKGRWYIVDWLKTACACPPGQTIMDMLIHAQGKPGLVFEVRHQISERSKMPYPIIGDFLPFGTNV